MSEDKLNNLANRITTIDTNGRRQSSDLARRTRALYEIISNVRRRIRVTGSRTLLHRQHQHTQTDQCPVNLCSNCIHVHGWNTQPPRALHKLETRRRETGLIVKGDGNAFISLP